MMIYTIEDGQTIYEVEAETEADARAVAYQASHAMRHREPEIIEGDWIELDVPVPGKLRQVRVYPQPDRVTKAIIIDKREVEG